MGAETRRKGIYLTAMSRWTTYRINDVDFDFDHIDQSPAVYAIYCDGYLYYVGQSSRPRNRLQLHHKIRQAAFSNSIVTRWGFFSSVWIKISYSRKYGEELMREARIIRRLRPPKNISGVINGELKDAGATP